MSNEQATPKCPHGCRGRLRWVDTHWYCKVCGDEWGSEVEHDGDERVGREDLNDVG